MKKLNAWRVATASYRVLFTNVPTFINSAWLLLIISILISFISTLEVFYFNVIIKFIFWGVSLLCTAVFLVRWHRVILADEKNQGFFYFRFGYRERRFIIKSIFIAIWAFVFLTPIFLFLFPAIESYVTYRYFNPGSPFIKITTGVIAIILSGVLLRLSLALPAAAIDNHGLGISKSWDLLKGNSIRFITVGIFIPVPFYFLYFGLSYILSNVFTDLGWERTLILLSINEIIDFIAAAVAAGYLSYAYKQLVLDEEI